MKRILLLPAIIGALILTGCSKTAASDIPSSEKKSATESSDKEVQTDDELIAEAVKKSGKTSDDIRDYLIKDFDGDGANEGFVVIGDEVDPDWSTCDGDLYYVSGGGCEHIFGPFTLGVSDENDMIYTINTDDKDFVTVIESYATDSVSRIYYVEDGKCKESAASGIGTFAECSYADGYCVSYGTYDEMYEYEEGNEEGYSHFLGHTWKHYYYYYDNASGDFKEYGCREATADEINTACGIDLTGEIEQEGYQIDAIFKRDNGIFNVNYSKTEKDGLGMVQTQYGNVVFNANTHEFVDIYNAGEKTWQNSNFGGIYYKSVAEAIGKESGTEEEEQ